jgi:hypothetical protein
MEKDISKKKLEIALLYTPRNQNGRSIRVANTTRKFDRHDKSLMSASFYKTPTCSELVGGPVENGPCSLSYAQYSNAVNQVDTNNDTSQHLLNSKRGVAMTGAETEVHVRYWK